MNRREFFGGVTASVTGLMGLRKVEAAPLPMAKPKLIALDAAVDRLLDMVHLRSNNDKVQSILDGMKKYDHTLGMWNWLLREDGMVCLWVSINSMAMPKECFILRAIHCIPQPATLPKYPNGYYRFGSVQLDVRHVVRYKAPHPLLSVSNPQRHNKEKQASLLNHMRIAIRQADMFCDKLQLKLSELMNKDVIIWPSIPIGAGNGEVLCATRKGVPA